MNHNTWVEELFSDTLMRRKFVLVFSGVLANDCGVWLKSSWSSEESVSELFCILQRNTCGKILLHLVQLFTIELLINFFRSCPCEYNLWTKCLLHQPSVWESCICLIRDKLSCLLYWSLNWVAFGLFPLCWEFKLNCHPYLNSLGTLFWFIVVNFELFVLVLFGFVGCCCCCWFSSVNGWSPVRRWDLLRRKLFGHVLRIGIGGSFIPEGAYELELRKKLTYFCGCWVKERLLSQLSAFWLCTQVAQALVWMNSC